MICFFIKRHQNVSKQTTHYTQVTYNESRKKKKKNNLRPIACISKKFIFVQKTIKNLITTRNIK